MRRALIRVTVFVLAVSLLIPGSGAIAGGVTIITHGYTGLFENEAPGWLDPMAMAIAERQIGSANPSSVWRIVVEHVPFPHDVTFQHVSGPNPWAGADYSGELILIVDWADLANLAALIPTDQIAEALALRLLNLQPQPGRYWIEGPIHLVGFSRGASVVSALARALGEGGAWVDQLTLLDPHPVDGVNEDCPGFFGDAIDMGDEALYAHSTVAFIESYYRQDFDGLPDEGAPCGVPCICDPDGEAVDGALNVALSEFRLNDLLEDCPFWEGYCREHFDVHLWYHGTIDQRVGAANDGTASVPHSWYEGYTDNRRGPRSRVGYNYSRIRNESEILMPRVPWDPASEAYEGYHPSLGGPAGTHRENVNLTFAVWPNILRFEVVGGPTFTVGDQVRVTYFYHDYDSDATIRFYLDTDRNPHNGYPVFLGSKLLQRTPTSYPWDDGAFLNTQGLTPGEYYVAAEIRDTTRRRFAYALRKIQLSECQGQGNDVSLGEIEWLEDSGDGDGCPEAGEHIDVYIPICASANIGSVEATLRATPASILDCVSDCEVWYGSIAAGQCASPDDFDMQILVGDINVHFTLHVEYIKNGQALCRDFEFSRLFPSACPEAEFRVCAESPDVEDDEDCGNDNVFHSGDDLDLRFALRNLGTFTVPRVEAAVDFNDAPPGVIIDGGRIDYDRFGDIAPGECAWPTSLNSAVDIDAERTYSGTFCADVLIIHDGRDPNDPLVIEDGICVTVHPKPWISVLPRNHDLGVIGTGKAVTFDGQVRNNGSAELDVNAIEIVAPNGIDVQVTPPLPWTSIPPAFSQAVMIRVEATNFEGQIDPSIEVIFRSNGCIDGNDTQTYDRITVTGLVSDALPVFPVPNIVGAEFPDVSGTVLVWADYRNRNGDIYGYDIVSRTEIPIAVDSSEAVKPFVSGNLVAWVDRRNELRALNADIFAYDLNTGEEYPVSTNPAEEDLVGVDNGLIAIMRLDETLPGPCCFCEVWNLVVFQYDGEGVFREVYSTNFATAEYDDDDNDFGEGLLVLNKPCSATFEIIGFDSGGMIYQPTLPQAQDPIAAVAHRFVYKWESGDSDDTHIHMWRTNQQEEVVVPPLDMGGGDYCNPGDDVIAIGGPDGSDIAVYDYDCRERRNGLYFWDRATNTERLLVDPGLSIDFVRMDGYVVVWWEPPMGTLKYAVFNQPDITVTTFAVEPSGPFEGTTMAFKATIQNASDYDSSEDTIVRLYDGDPDGGGTQIGPDHTIGPLVARATIELDIENIPVPPVLMGDQQEYEYCIRVFPAGIDDPENNMACVTVNVQDDDTEGPDIRMITIEEHDGNGDGDITACERIRVSWTLSDASGIASTEAQIDDGPTEPGTLESGERYFAVFDAVSAGTHNVVLRATDADATPEPSEASRDLSVLVDADCDGITDPRDNCPTAANEDQADRDGDDVGDVCDACPDDSTKTGPGECGCGVPDSDLRTWYDDSDGDGCGDPNDMIQACSQPAGYVANPDDQCPDDGSKCQPGECGCGTPDSNYRTWYGDGDADGCGDPNDLMQACSQPPAYVANRDDRCPDDGSKCEPGQCGCGTPDTDSDDDGSPDCIDPCPDDALDQCESAMLTVNVLGPGTVAVVETGSGRPIPISPGVPTPLPSSTNLTLTAEVGGDECDVFGSWQGDVESSNDVVDISLTHDMSVTAVFVDRRFVSSFCAGGTCQAMVVIAAGLMFMRRRR